MNTTTQRLNSDLYQLTGEEQSLEHIAGSGNLSVASLYANHGSEQQRMAALAHEQNLPFSSVMQMGTALPTGIAAPSFEQALGRMASAESNDTPSMLNLAPAGSVVGDGTSLLANLDHSSNPNRLDLDFQNFSGSASSSVQTARDGTDGVNGTDGSSGFDGIDGTDGDPGDGTPQTDGPHPHLPHINITDIHVGLPGLDINLLPGHGTPLIDIDILGDQTVSGDDNNLVDLNILGGNTVTGNDNDLIDLDLIGHNYVGGNDNDGLDLDLLGHNTVVGNDNDVIDLDLFSSNNVQGNDNDLIDLGLNDHSTNSGTDNDVIDLDLNLLDNGSSQPDGSQLIGLDVDLMNDNGLAGIDLSLGDQQLVDIGLNPADSGDSNALVDLSVVTGDLLGGSGDGLLSDDLNIDLGLNNPSGDDTLPDGGGLLDTLGLDASAPPVDSHGGGGTVLGLNLGLGAWV